MRILVVTHAPLDPEAGAGQMALNLARAFRALGHEVEAWSAAQVRAPWWRWRARARRALDAHLRSLPAFDVIDCPETLLTATLSRAAPVVVARSVQPALRYLWHERPRLANWRPAPLGRTLAAHLDGLGCALDALQGWRRAGRILCLGLAELRWMERRFPWWRGKLDYYVNALAPEEQDSLARLRDRRTHRTLPTGGCRFLWIGRWARHKGVGSLVEFIGSRSSRHPEDRFTLAGAGDAAPPAGLAALRERGRLVLVPQFGREQLARLLWEHDAGLFTSRVEGWGLVLNEMLEAGLPVFATRAGGVTDLERFFAGQLLPFPPARDWQPSPGSVFSPPPEYYSECSWDAIARRYLRGAGGELAPPE